MSQRMREPERIVALFLKLAIQNDGFRRVTHRTGVVFRRKGDSDFPRSPRGVNTSSSSFAKWLILVITG